MSVIETLNEMKNVLMERGWCQKKLENEAGNVCLLGARNIAVYGQSLQDMNGENDGCAIAYSPDKVSNTIVEAIHIITGEPITFGSTGYVYAFNDLKGTTFNKVMELLDTAILNEKEKEDR